MFITSSHNPMDTSGVVAPNSSLPLHPAQPQSAGTASPLPTTFGEQPAHNSSAFQEAAGAAAAAAAVATGQASLAGYHQPFLLPVSNSAPLPFPLAPPPPAAPSLGLWPSASPAEAQGQEQYHHQGVGGTTMRVMGTVGTKAAQVVKKGLLPESHNHHQQQQQPISTQAAGTRRVGGPAILSLAVNKQPHHSSTPAAGPTAAAMPAQRIPIPAFAEAKAAARHRDAGSEHVSDPMQCSPERERCCEEGSGAVEPAPLFGTTTATAGTHQQQQQLLGSSWPPRGLAPVNRLLPGGPGGVPHRGPGGSTGAACTARQAVSHASTEGTPCSLNFLAPPAAAAPAQLHGSSSYQPLIAAEQTPATRPLPFPTIGVLTSSSSCAAMRKCDAASHHPSAANVTPGYASSSSKPSAPTSLAGATPSPF
jgi:hypothetical protein